MNANLQTARPIVIVLGMHRSGTSLLSEIIHRLGVDMADESDRASPKNPRGFWERPVLNAFHDRVLEAIGRPLRSPAHAGLFPHDWWKTEAVQAIKAEMKTWLAARLVAEPGLWGFKDPRACRLLPLWEEVMEDLGLRPVYVWALRPGGEAAASMAKKSPGDRILSLVECEAMWLAYMHDIARDTLASDPTVVRYADWFDHPHRTLGQLRAGLQRSIDLPQVEDDRVLEVVNAEYRHEREPEFDGAALAPQMHQVYRQFGRLAQEADRSDAQGEIRSTLDRLRLVLQVIGAYADLLGELPALRKQAAERDKLAAQLAAARQDLAKILEIAQARGLEIARLQKALNVALATPRPTA
ncbi:sulfotransferase family protein [Phenylobacterium immobile]|uniref:sulfotransferase family protein n=1 Tax=Phenylobacterium immobile TaxID=21 RepID=UPI000A71D0AE|nr:hypothetical protein [Phenylobacterium immobile]